jgi:hypothetical protein
MTRFSRKPLVTTLGLFALLAACADGGSGAAPAPTQQKATSEALIDLASAPSDAVAIAQSLVQSAAGTDAAPNWDESTSLGNDVYVYYRSDVEGPAYYEFTVSTGGHVLVATGKHDAPVSSFNDVGGPTGQNLLDEAAQNRIVADRLYHLDSFRRIAVDADDYVISSSMPGLNASHRLEEFAKTSESAENRDKSGGEDAEWQATVDEQWASLYQQREKWNDSTIPYGGNPNVAVTDVRWLYHKELLRTSILWDQIDVDPLATICWAGCGTVAFGQVAAYLAYSTRWGNPKYAGSGSEKLYPNVSTAATAPEAIALLKVLHTKLDSVCWAKATSGIINAGDQSFVSPWNMDNFKTWASSKGANVNLVSKYSTGGDRTASWNALRAGNPVVFGWGAYSHYNVGIGAAYLNGTQYVYVNNGWGTDTTGGGYLAGWLPYGKNSMFYSGIIQSWVSGT